MNDDKWAKKERGLKETYILFLEGQISLNKIGNKKKTLENNNSVFLFFFFCNYVSNVPPPLLFNLLLYWPLLDTHHTKTLKIYLQQYQFLSALSTICFTSQWDHFQAALRWVRYTLTIFIPYWCLSKHHLQLNYMADRVKAVPVCNACISFSEFTSCHNLSIWDFTSSSSPAASQWRDKKKMVKEALD